jgi:hypothetical protein
MSRQEAGQLAKQAGSRRDSLARRGLSTALGRVGGGDERCVLATAAQDGTLPRFPVYPGTGTIPRVVVAALQAEALTAWPAEYIADYLAAITPGIVFQCLVIAPMHGLRLRIGLNRGRRG